MNLTVVPLDAARRSDFLAVMSRSGEEPAACLCTAYHGCDHAKAPACREALFAEKRLDGLLLYVDGVPAGWCQCGPRLAFSVFGTSPQIDASAWAITCLVVAPEFRGRGLAHALLKEALAAARRSGAPSAIACGHRLGPTYSSPLPELPESACVKAGMTLLKDDAECPLYVMRWP